MMHLGFEGSYSKKASVRCAAARFTVNVAKHTKHVPCMPRLRRSKPTKRLDSSVRSRTALKTAFSCFWV
eukprot:6207698-Pleurochrysis_carterae.AAC.1